MKVVKINNAFEKLGRFQIKNRLWFLISLAFLTIFCFLGLPRLKLTNNEDDWFDNWEQVQMNQNHFEEIFGGTDSIVVFIKAKDVFDPEVLSMIDTLGKELLQNVPYADSVTSLMNLSIPVGTEDGFEVNNPFEDGVPTNSLELAKKKDFILSRESLVNSLVSKDATETFLLLNLEQYSESLMDVKRKIAPPAMKVINSPQFNSTKWEISPAGLSYTEYEEELAMQEQCVSRIIIGFFVMTLFLVIFIKSLRGVIIPAIATIGGIGTVIGASSWMNIEGNSVMIIVVILLSMALAVGYSVHYINCFKLNFRKTGNRKESAIFAIKESGWPILFTVVTTVAGMLSFYASGLRPMRWVGGICAASVLGVYLYVMILLPILLSYGKDKIPDNSFTKTDGLSKTDFLIEKCGSSILAKKWIVVAVSSIILIATIPFIFKIKINMNATDMMGTKIPYVARLLKIAKSQLGSQYSYDVLIEYDYENAIKDPQVLKNMDELARRIGTLNLTKISNGKPRVSSITKLVKEMNRTLNEDDASFYYIPDDYDIVNQILFLYEISGGEDLFEYVNEDFSAAFLHVEMNDYNADDCVKNIALVEQWVKELFPDTVTSGVVGEIMQFAQMNAKLVKGSLKSIATSFLIIFILLAIAFTSIKTGFIAMIPNISPVILIGGVMGLANYPLDMVTALIMPMILGIAVDDTIHFTNHIKYHFELCQNYKQAILCSYREIGKSMIMTTLILCAMFAVFIFCDMAALVRIGQLSVIGMTSALIADYTITPVVMLITKPFGKEKSK